MCMNDPPGEYKTICEITEFFKELLFRQSLLTEFK